MSSVTSVNAGDPPPPPPDPVKGMAIVVVVGVAVAEDVEMCESVGVDAETSNRLNPSVESIAAAEAAEFEAADALTTGEAPTAPVG